jgi:hypothetical protein
MQAGKVDVTRLFVMQHHASLPFSSYLKLESGLKLKQGYGCPLK